MKRTQAKLLPLLGLSLDVLATKTIEQVAADFEKSMAQGGPDNSTCGHIYMQQDFYENMMNPDLHDQNLEGNDYLITYYNDGNDVRIACRDFKARTKFYPNASYNSESNKKVGVWDSNSPSMKKVWREWKKKTPGKMKRARFTCVDGTWVQKTRVNPENYPAFLPECPQIAGYGKHWENDVSKLKGIIYKDFSLIIPAYVYPWDVYGGPFNARWQAIVDSVINYPDIMHHIVIQ